MDKALYEAIKRVEKIKSVMYGKCQRDVEFIISNKITDEQRIDMVFDEIMDFFEDEDFLDLFWKLVKLLQINLEVLVLGDKNGRYYPSWQQF